MSSPRTGRSLGGGVYKIRLAIKSKGKGKRGGARIISLYLERDSELFLLTIYDKSEQESLPESQIRMLVQAALAFRLQKD